MQLRHSLRSFQGKHRLRRLRSYGQLAKARPEIVYPRNESELAEVFRRAREEARKITLRGGGHSFDAQSLGDDLVISFQFFDRIVALDREEKLITVEPGTSWKAILRHVVPHDLLPLVVVTTGHATAGGTVAANCLSRSSVLYGREINQVESLRFMTLDGTVRSCSRTENAALFFEVVGSFGYLGAVTQITYRLREIAAGARVETHVTKYEGTEHLLPALKRRTRKFLSAHGMVAAAKARAPVPRTLPPEEDDDQQWDAIYSVAFFTARGKRGVVFRSRYLPREATADEDDMRKLRRRGRMRLGGLALAVLSLLLLAGLWMRAEAGLRVLEDWIMLRGVWGDSSEADLRLAKAALVVGLGGLVLLAAGWRAPRPVRTGEDPKAVDRLNRDVRGRRALGLFVVAVSLGLWAAAAVREAHEPLLVAVFVAAGIVALLLVRSGWRNLPELRRPSRPFKRYKRFLLFWERHVIRVPLEYAVRLGPVSRLIWKMSYSFIDDDTLYVDPLFDYTFFMDANRRAKGWVWPVKLPSVQQTFIIPQNRLRRFVEGLAEKLEEADLRPTLFDILFVSGDQGSPSPRRHGAAYAVSVAFEDLNRSATGRLRETCLPDINELCLDCDGRVSLVKNAYVTREQFKRMYGTRMTEFCKLKRLYDPNGQLRNDFFDRLFGEDWRTW